MLFKDSISANIGVSVSSPPVPALLLFHSSSVILYQARWPGIACHHNVTWSVTLSECQSNLYLSCLPQQNKPQPAQKCLCKFYIFKMHIFHVFSVMNWALCKSSQPVSHDTHQQHARGAATAGVCWAFTPFHRNEIQISEAISTDCAQICQNVYNQNPEILKENSGAKWTFGLITHWYLVNCSLRFVFMIIKCKEFYL